MQCTVTSVSAFWSKYLQYRCAKLQLLCIALLHTLQLGRWHCSMMLQHVLAAGGNLNQPGGPNGTTPLMAAAGHGHYSCLQQLLERHANASYTSPDGYTALMAAASGGHTQCVSALIKAGAALDGSDNRGLSALMRAVAAGHVEVVQCLIRHRAALERLPSQVCVHVGLRRGNVPERRSPFV